MTEHQIAGALAVIIGILMVVFRRPLGEFQIRSQNQFWSFRMGARSVAMSQAMIGGIGVALVVLGAQFILARD